MNSIYEKAFKKMIDFNVDVTQSLNVLLENENNQHELFWVLHKHYISSDYSAIPRNKKELELMEKVGFKVVENKVDILDTIKRFEADNHILTTYSDNHTITYHRTSVMYLKNANNGFWSGRVGQKRIDEFISTAQIMEKVRMQSLRYMYIASIFKGQFDFGAGSDWIKAYIKSEYNYDARIKVAKEYVPVFYNLFLETRCTSLTENEVKGM